MLTLVLNVNNNINNNNNNNNNLNINAVDSSNVVANFNTNNANQVNTLFAVSQFPNCLINSIPLFEILVEHMMRMRMRELKMPKNTQN